MKEFQLFFTIFCRELLKRKIDLKFRNQKWIFSSNSRNSHCLWTNSPIVKGSNVDQSWMDNPRVSSYLFGNFFRSIPIHLLVGFNKYFLSLTRSFLNIFQFPSFQPFPNCIRTSQIMIWVFHPNSFKIGSSNIQGWKECFPSISVSRSCHELE